MCISNKFHPVLSQAKVPAPAPPPNKNRDNGEGRVTYLWDQEGLTPGEAKEDHHRWEQRN